MFCVKCGFKFETINAVYTDWTNRCPNCRQIEQSEKQIEAMRDINRENDLRDRQMRQLLQQQNQENAWLLNQLISEQQNTQKLLQEQSITQDQAYNTGYELPSKSPSSISFIKINPETGRINFNAERQYFTDILHEKYLEGLWDRIQEKVTVPDREFIKQSVATAAKNAWSGIVYTDADSVDNFKFDYHWEFCRVEWREQDDGLMVPVYRWEISDMELINIYESEYKVHINSKNTPELVQQRIVNRQNAIEKQNARKVALKRKKFVQNLMPLWWVLLFSGLLSILYLVSENNHMYNLSSMNYSQFQNLVGETNSLPFIFGFMLGLLALYRSYVETDSFQNAVTRGSIVFFGSWLLAYIFFGIFTGKF